jgi:hypothetical protein
MQRFRPRVAAYLPILVRVKSKVEMKDIQWPEILEDLPRLGIENHRGANGLTACRFNFVRRMVSPSSRAIGSTTEIDSCRNSGTASLRAV